VEGENFGLSSGLNRCSIVRPDGGVVAIYPTGTDDHLTFQIPDLYWGMSEFGDDVELRVTNNSDGDWRRMHVYPAESSGTVDTTFVGAVPSMPIVGSTLRVKFRLYSRANGNVVLLPRPVAFIDGRIVSTPIRVLDESDAPISDVAVVSGGEREFSISIDSIPAGGVFGVAVGIESSVGRQPGSGLVTFTLGQQAVQPSAAVDLSLISVEGRPSGASAEITNGYQLEVGPNATARLNGVATFLDAGTYLFKAGMASDAGWAVASVSGDSPLVVIRAGDQLPAAVIRGLNVYRVWPDAGSTELVWTVTHQDTGTRRELRFLVGR